MHNSEDIFLIILLVLFAGRLFAEIFRKLNLPSVIGEILAGIIIGPSLFGWVELSDTLQLLAEIGIILLLFEVGLETDPKALLRNGKYAVPTALFGFILPFAGGSLLGLYVFGFDLVVSLFIGGTITATSIGITVRALRDINKHNTVEGNVVIGSAVLDDILGVILLAILHEFSQTGKVDLLDVSKVMIFIVGFLIFSPILLKAIIYLVKHYDQSDTTPGLLTTSVFMLVLFFGWFAKKLGAPEIIGGFTAGLALSRRFFLPLGAMLKQDNAFAQKLEAQIKPLIYLFTPFFFVSVGLSIDFRSIAWDQSQIWLLSFLILLSAIIGKITAPLFFKKLDLKSRLTIGLSMIPRGEVGLIFVQLGKQNGMLDDTLYAALLLVIVVTTIIPPFLIRLINQDL